MNQLFADTANLAEIIEANEMGAIQGVTTNPSIIAKEPKGSFEALIQKLAEYCGAEEVSHLGGSASEEPLDGNKTSDRSVLRRDNGSEAESKPQRCGIGRATQAKCRALYALTKRAEYSEEDIENLIAVNLDIPGVGDADTLAERAVAMARALGLDA